MKLRMSTVGTLTDVTAEVSGFTVHDGMRSFPLHIGNVMSGRKKRRKGMIPDLLYFIVTDGDHLPSDQKDYGSCGMYRKQDGYRLQWKQAIYDQAVL